MKINVGSKNQQKVDAVREAFLEFPEFAAIEILSRDVDSGVSNQPKNIAETVQGAINRAKSAFVDCDYSVGLESGLIEVPQTKSGYMDMCVCAIYDGKNIHLGGSSAFEYPKTFIDLVFSKGYEIDEAAKATGFTEDPRIGKSTGVVGVLTRGKVSRKEHCKQSVMTALVHLLNPEHY